MERQFPWIIPTFHWTLCIITNNRTLSRWPMPGSSSITCRVFLYTIWRYIKTLQVDSRRAKHSRSFSNWNHTQNFHLLTIRTINITLLVIQASDTSTVFFSFFSFFGSCNTCLSRRHKVSNQLLCISKTFITPNLIPLILILKSISFWQQYGHPRWIINGISKRVTEISQIQFS